MNSIAPIRIGYFQFVAIFCAMVLVLLFSMHYRLGPELADDGAFFLRYAENMLRGEFWVWNPGEAPVWGASAPLYPLLIALPMALGVSPETAIVGVGLALASVSLAAVAAMLGHRFGSIVGLAFFAFSALDTGIMYFSGAGLETPLTLALLSIALATLLYPSRSWQVGLVAGLLMINKLDLVPFGGLLLLAHWWNEKKFPKMAVTVAVALAGAWYGFAWLYFGAPVPNSFLTKSLHQESQPKIIDWTWFGGFVLWFGVHKWFSGLALIGAWANRREIATILMVLGGGLLAHLVAYTIKYPFEPYNWYAMPTLFSLLVFASIGFGGSVHFLVDRISGNRWVQSAVSLLGLGLIVGMASPMERLGTQNIKMFSSHHEYDRSEAGRWVAENTPKDFVVYSMWGNPAYYSERKVIDGSFLNRKYEPGDVVAKYRPEILILQNNPGSTPMSPVFAATRGEEYRVVKVFDKTYGAGMDYFFAVLAREDVLDRVRNIEPPRDLMEFVGDVSLGDQFGLLKANGVGTLFIHPGATTSTAFAFKAKDYLGDSPKKELSIHARIAPNVPLEAIQRGGANVRLRVRAGDKVLIDSIVRVGEPVVRTVSIDSGERLTFDVDNNGGADTDWLLLSIR